MERNAERTRSKISLICGKKNRYHFPLLCFIRSAKQFQKVTLISFQQLVFTVQPRINAQVLISLLLIHPSLFIILPFSYSFLFVPRNEYSMSHSKN